MLEVQPMFVSQKSLESNGVAERLTGRVQVLLLPQRYKLVDWASVSLRAPYEIMAWFRQNMKI